MGGWPSADRQAGGERLINALDELAAREPSEARRSGDALRSEAEELRRQLHDYEQLRAGEIKARSLRSLTDLPRAPIEARIAGHVTQKQLADGLELAEQQIQRWEATNYAGVGVERMQTLPTRSERGSPRRSASARPRARREGTQYPLNRSRHGRLGRPSGFAPSTETPPVRAEQGVPESRRRVSHLARRRSHAAPPASESRLLPSRDDGRPIRCGGSPPPSDSEVAGRRPSARTASCLLAATTRRRNRTFQAGGCPALPVLKTGWATRPLPRRD